MEEVASSQWDRIWMSSYLSAVHRTLLMRTLSNSYHSRSGSRQLPTGQGAIDATYRPWSQTSKQMWEVGVAYSHRLSLAMWRQNSRQAVLQRQHFTRRQGRRKFSHLIGEFTGHQWDSLSRITLSAIGTQPRIRQQRAIQLAFQSRQLQTRSEMESVQCQ